MKEVVFLVEEPSAKKLLDGFLPNFLPGDWGFRCIPFEGKQDLEKRMVRVLRAWQNPDARFVVMRDQDSGDCRRIKKSLLERCANAHRSDVLVRVVCRELESWIVGDLEAFSNEFASSSANKARNRAKFRDPDLLGSPFGELRKFVPGYQKNDGARRMGLLLDPTRNSSTSFRFFCDGLLRLVDS